MGRGTAEMFIIQRAPGRARDSDRTTLYPQSSHAYQKYVLTINTIETLNESTYVTRQFSGKNFAAMYSVKHSVHVEQK